MTFARGILIFVAGLLCLAVAGVADVQLIRLALGWLGAICAGLGSVGIAAALLRAVLED